MEEQADSHIKKDAFAILMSNRSAKQSSKPAGRRQQPVQRAQSHPVAARQRADGLHRQTSVPAASAQSATLVLQPSHGNSHDHDAGSKMFLGQAVARQQAQQQQHNGADDAQHAAATQTAHPAPQPVHAATGQAPAQPSAATSSPRNTDAAEQDPTDASVPPAKRPRLTAQSACRGARQRFDYLVVYDLEATCNKAKSLQPVEIIELSACIIDSRTCSITAQYQAYVRPTEHPLLDPFCTQLTGIQQEWVDAAQPLQQVLQQHEAWLQEQGLLSEACTWAPVTWTDWDFKIAMETECKWRHIMKPAYFNRWVDLKKQYQRKYRHNGNLRSCVEHVGLFWEGRAHSGIDDAMNTARLAVHMIKNGCVLAVSDSFGPASASAASAGGSAASGGKVVRQATLTPVKQQVYDSQGRWTGSCKCGVKAHHRVTKKPGVNHGRAFYSCGRWTITQKFEQCDFFLWADELPAG